MRFVQNSKQNTNKNANTQKDSHKARSYIMITLESHA